MAFLLYKEHKQNHNLYITSLKVSFSLAGYNSIYDLWNEKGSPINKGWEISCEELSKYHQKKLNVNEPLHFIIDFDPKSKSRIGLIEILNIYLFTVDDDYGKIAWTPIMLKMQDIIYKEYYDEKFPDDKKKIINKIKYPPQNDVEDFVEFLYLNGDDKGWNWGRNGMTNAVFIQSDARDY